MYIAIRNKIRELSEDNGWFQELNTYVKILTENLTIDYESTYSPKEKYEPSLNSLKEYLLQEPVYTNQYFEASKARILRILDGVIPVLCEYKGLIPDAHYKPNFNDESDIYIAKYELDHIGYFQQYPAKHENYYPHSRLKDEVWSIGDSVGFKKDTILLPIMQEDISNHLSYLRQQFP